MKKSSYIKLCFLLLTAVLLCTACGNHILGTSIKLAKTEGRISVLDEKSRELEPVEDMGLYNGYQMTTGQESYSWINLDSVKLTKMDQNSDITIQKFGKRLEVLVNSGSLFFHVTEPLKEDETLNIRTSTMSVGIRGTCGWVEVAEPGQMLVHILEGTVECSITGRNSAEPETRTVSGGETAVLEMKDGQGTISVERFQEEEIPSFVMEELQQDEVFYQEVLDILDDLSGDGTTDQDSAENNPDENDPEENTLDSSQNPEDIIALNHGFQIIRTNSSEINCLSGAGGVILTGENNLYGAVNYNNEVIVPNSYPIYYMMPNEEGQFILGDSEQAHVFDRDGNILLTVSSPCDNWSVHASEGTVVYSHLVENGVPEVCCYDIAGGTYLLQIKLDDNTGREELGPYTKAKVTAMENGVFYYSGNEGNLYQAGRNGQVVQIDTAWEQAMLENHIPHYPFKRNWPAYASEDGYLAAYAWDVLLHTLFDCNTMKWYTFGLELPEDLLFESEYIHYYYSNGKAYGNKGMQMVISNEAGRYSLLDFTRARTDASGYVLNMPEVVIAEYDYIELCGEGYCYAEEGDRQFYLDENGRPVTSFQPVRCSAFYDGYAAVIDSDSLAYIVDADFNRVSAGYPADSVYQAYGLLCIQNGTERIFFSIPR